MLYEDRMLYLDPVCAVLSGSRWYARYAVCRMVMLVYRVLSSAQIISCKVRVSS